jgi:hypothetical protein
MRETVRFKVYSEVRTNLVKPTGGCDNELVTLCTSGEGAASCMVSNNQQHTVVRKVQQM